MKEIINSQLDKDLVKNLLQLSNECMKEALKKKPQEVFMKPDNTIVTNTDKNIHNIISNRLLNLYPKIPLISEEGNFNKNSFLHKIYWLIDPLDGTSSFVKGGTGYTINIALIKNGYPCLGLIANPPSKTIWYGSINKAFVIKNKIKRKLAVRSLDKKNITIVTSKNLDQATRKFIEKFIGAKINSFSSSIKFCKLAEGKADIYPRLQSISKWDIAAGDAILRASGGKLLNNKGQEYRYNTASAKSGEFFAVSTSLLLDEHT